MSFVNAIIGFDSNLFIKSKNQKLVYRIKTKNNRIKNKRIVAKIIKMNENNQYGNAMTKPLPTGCIKKKKNYTPNYRELQLLLEVISHTDKIGHLFIVDIEL